MFNLLKYSLFGWAWLLASLPAWGQEKLQVAVAANLLAPSKAIARAFEKKQGAKVEVIGAATGTLSAQIMQGAPFHLFFAADDVHTQLVFDKGFAHAKPFVVTHGHVVMWSKKSLGKTQAAAWLKAQAPGRVAIAQPELAPYGAKVLAWLKANGLLPILQKALIYGENVSKVNQYIATGTVDVAFTANSAMKAPELAAKGYWTPLADAQGKPLTIPHTAVLLKKGAGHPHAALFAAFLQSAEAQGILRTYGYTR